MLHLHAILHPTDFSSHSDYAFRLACALAKDHGARLILVHVMRPTIVYADVGVVVKDDGQREMVLEQLQQLKAPESVPVEYRLEEGDPASEIVRVAQETGCDLIVMATHGRRGLSRLLMGSVAELTMRKAPWPVLTVKVPTAEQKPLATEIERDLVEV